mgnify:CR=1 FL=1
MPKYTVQSVNNASEVIITGDIYKSLSSLIDFCESQVNLLDLKVAIDLSHAPYIDSLTIGKLLKLRRIITQTNRSMLLKVTDQYKSILDAAGLSTLFGVKG